MICKDEQDLFIQKEEINKLLKAAHDKYDSAILLFDNMKNADAVVMAYYTLCIGLQAALRYKNADAIDASAMADLFMKNFVDEKIFDISAVNTFKKLQELTNKFLYTSNQEANRQECGQLVSDVCKFIKQEQDYFHELFQTTTEKKVARVFKKGIKIVSVSMVIAGIIIFAAYFYHRAKTSYIEGESLINYTIDKTPPNILAGMQKSWWGATGAKHLLVQTRAENEEVGLRIFINRDAYYDIYAYMTKAQDYAIVQFGINGKDIGESIDLYSRTVEKSDKIYIGKASLKKGENIISVRVIGKNSNSKGYFFGIDQIILKRGMQ